MCDCSVKPGMLTSVHLDGAADVIINSSALASEFHLATKGSGLVAVDGGDFKLLNVHLLGYSAPLLKSS